LNIGWQSGLSIAYENCTSLASRILIGGTEAVVEDISHIADRLRVEHTLLAIARASKKANWYA
jgi:hypothetical protein